MLFMPPGRREIKAESSSWVIGRLYSYVEEFQGFQGVSSRPPVRAGEAGRKPPAILWKTTMTHQEVMTLLGDSKH